MTKVMEPTLRQTGALQHVMELLGDSRSIKRRSNRCGEDQTVLMPM